MYLTTPATLHMKLDRPVLTIETGRGRVINLPADRRAVFRLMLAIGSIARMMPGGPLAEQERHLQQAFARGERFVVMS